jgi:hypothetical protein
MRLVFTELGTCVHLFLQCFPESNNLLWVIGTSGPMIDNGSLFWGALVIFLKGRLHKKSASLKTSHLRCSHCKNTEESPYEEKSTDSTTYLQKMKVQKNLK